jgi:DUF4097 and DUF4098 domain-containing protein YvlB
MGIRRIAAWGILAGLALAMPGVQAADAGRERPDEQGARRDRSDNGGRSATETRSFTVGRGSVLDLANVTGDVTISGTRGDTIRVDSVRRPRGRADSARDQQVEVEIRHVGNRVEVRTRHPRSGRTADTVDFTVTVPDDAAVTAKSVSGDVTLKSVGGDVRVESVSGSVEVAEAPNVALAKSVSGNVTVRDIASGGTLALDSVSGTVVATRVRARSVDAGSVSGNVRVSGVEAPHVAAKTVSGDVEVAGALARGGRFEFTSHSGDVQLHLPAGSGLDLSADSHSGRIHSDFPITLRSGRSGRSLRTIRGVVGDGSTVVIVRSFSGNVTLTRQ